jgi:hypothetical protein
VVRHSSARIFVGLVAIAVLAAPLAADAGPARGHTAASTRRGAHALHVGQLGAVPVHSAGSAAPINAETAANKKLEYHGGPVMLSSHTYTIFWEPTTCGGSPCSVEAGYNAGINKYFADAAADSGGTQNVYSTLNQYYEIKGGQKKHVQYAQTFAGSTVDTTAFPASGCSFQFAGTSSVCLTDKQIRKEVQKVIIAQGWSGTKSNAFFLLLPSDVNTCFDSGGSACAFKDFCAYHSAFALPDGSPAIYANDPYGGTSIASCGANNPGGALVAPNSDDLDATLNAMSHEHREMTNDPFGNGWWDNQSGFEGSDQCAYKFGPTLSPGGPNNGDYNQVINSADYLVQMEWSNRSLKCVQRGT